MHTFLFAQAVEFARLRNVPSRAHRLPVRRDWETGIIVLYVVSLGFGRVRVRFPCLESMKSLLKVCQVSKTLDR